jgi:shikimate dehydrogenase
MFGLIGKKLSHSFSKEIHEILHSESYNLIELPQLDSFFHSKQFKGVNVTIPYKEDVIKYLDVISDTVKKTNSVNTIINKGGFLYGYNTDYEGLKYLLEYNDINIKNKTVLILGNGATSRTVEVLCNELGAKKVVKAARSPKGNEVLLSSIDIFKDANILINATPSGMYPNNYDELIIDLEELFKLEAVVDLVYNPLETRLISKAISLNLIAVNGLMMLVRQAVKSCELFHNQKYNDSKTINIYKKIILNMLNIVLIGMPMSGKSYYAKALSGIYNKQLVDIDKQIVNDKGMHIPEIFEDSGEKGFREIETNTLMIVSKSLSQAISTGGGTVLNAKNIDYLKQNGIIIFLDVPLEVLKRMNPRNRPLLKDINNLTKLYNDRHHLYLKYADIVVNKTNIDENHILNMIEVKINEYINTKWS